MFQSFEVTSRPADGIPRLAALRGAMAEAGLDGVLIPRAEANIKKIRMALADAERDAVVRAKISKRKTAARAAEGRMAEL